MRQLIAHFQEYFQEQGVDYLSLDSKSQRILERKHTKKYLAWDKNRKITLALQRKGFFNKKGVPLLRARIELYIAIWENNDGQPDRKLYQEFERVIAESTAELFFSFTDKELKKHKSVDLIDSQRIIKEMQRLLKKPSMRNIESWVLETRPKCDTLEEVLEERYTLGSRFKRFFTRSASGNQIAQLENRIARLEKHNKTARTSELFKKYVHARNPSIVKIEVMQEAVSKNGSGYIYLVRGKVIFGGFDFFVFRSGGGRNPETLVHTGDFKKALLTFDKVASREDIH